MGLNRINTAFASLRKDRFQREQIRVGRVFQLWCNGALQFRELGAGRQRNQRQHKKDTGQFHQLFLHHVLSLAQAGFAFERTFINLAYMARTTGSHSDITGPRVRASALRLFAKGGYAAVSMRAIAAEVGVQAGALYNYTPDKQSLLFDLLRGHMQELLAHVPPLSPESATAQLDRFVAFHIEFHAERPDAVFISYMELRNLTPENFAAIEELRRQYEDHLESILRAGVASGQFDVSDTKIVTLAIIAMLTGVNTWFRAEGRLSLDQVVQQYGDMVRRAVAAA